MRRLLFAVILFLLFSAFFPRGVGGVSARSPSSYEHADIVPGELIVGLEPGARLSSLRLPAQTSLAAGHSGLSRLNAALVTVPRGYEQEYMAKLRGQPGVLFVEPNVRVEVMLIPDDTHWTQQYGPAQIQAPAAWDITTGSSSVVLAIIDSGVDTSHPEFGGSFLSGHDFVEDDSTPQDECGHGTHVAGIAAAQGNNAAGIAGIAWNVSILPIRVLNETCSGSTADIAEALVWAVERGARVINLSLGTSTPSSLMESGTYYAYTHGAAIFAAAGNTGAPTIYYPAAYPWVMAVGATGTTGLRSSYSNTGAALDLMAPGDSIFSTLPMETGFLYNHDCPNGPYTCGKSTEYDTLTGTSMASAHASGAAALLAFYPAFDSPDKIYEALISTALDMDAPGLDPNTGYGLIQLADALAFAPAIIPTPTPGPPAVSYDVVDSDACGNIVQYAWRDASGGTPILFLPGGNNGSALLSLPFTFDFGGVLYTTVTVSSNGYLTFGASGTSTENFIIPSIGQPNNFIAPFWDDLTASAGGTVYWSVTGAAPAREFIIEYNGVHRYVTQPFPQPPLIIGPLTFEVILFEGSNQILFQYETLTGDGSDGSSATIGVEYADGTAGREYSYNKADAVEEGLALLFIPFATGDTPPSNSCDAFTAPADSSGGFFDAPPFCLMIPPGALEHPATVQIQILTSAPHMPGRFLDLRHYADITISYSPAPPLSPVPEAYVCYHYTPEDVLAAGGHPENLLIVAYDSGLSRWEALATSVDSLNEIISARGPHFSIYGVATNDIEELPVTGGPRPDNNLSLWALGVLIAFILLRLWIRSRTDQEHSASS